MKSLNEPEDVSRIEEIRINALPTDNDGSHYRSVTATTQGSVSSKTKQSKVSAEQPGGQQERPGLMLRLLQLLQSNQLAQYRELCSALPIESQGAECGGDHCDASILELLQHPYRSWNWRDSLGTSQLLCPNHLMTRSISA